MATSAKSRKDQVLDLIREHDGPMKRKEILAQIDVSGTRLDNILEDLRSEGEVAKPKRGHYDLPSRVEQGLFEEDNRNNDIPEKLISYPLGRAGAGPGRKLQTDSLTVDKRLIRSEIGYLPDEKEAFWVNVDGESMEPWLKDGSFAFAVRQSEVTVPGRYVMWWGRDEAEICCYLAKMSDQTLLLRKYGPEKEYELKHQDGDLYEIPNGDTIRMQVQGRIVWPPSTAKSVMETVTDQMGKVLEQALNTS